MKTRHILFVIDSLGCGGAERSLVSLLRGIDHTDIHIHLLILNRGGVFEQYIPEYVDMVTLPEKQVFDKMLSHVCKAAHSIKWRLLRLAGVRRHMAETYWDTMQYAYPEIRCGYDVAVAYQQGFPTYYVSEKINAKRKIAWINTDMRKAGYRSAYNRRFYDKYHSVAVVSDILGAKLISDGYIPDEKTETVYDINDASHIRKLAKQTIPDIAAKPDILLLTTVGRMVPVKNYTLIVEAAKALKNKGIEFIWILVGDGEERSKVEMRIRQYGLSDNIRIMGMLPNPYPYIYRCHIYVSASQYEGFGLTLAEARILGKPVVTTNFPTAYEHIADGIDGFIVKQDAEMISEAIIRLHSNQKLYDKMVSNIVCKSGDSASQSYAAIDALLNT